MGSKTVRKETCLPEVSKSGEVFNEIMLGDRGEDGMSVVRNIKEMYGGGDGHVHVLAASFPRDR